MTSLHRLAGQQGTPASATHPVGAGEDVDALEGSTQRTSSASALCVEAGCTPSAHLCERRCARCRYMIPAGAEHVERPQPEGSNVVICSLRWVNRPLPYWRSGPPWPASMREPGESFICSRCQFEVEPYHRHFWQPCLRCNVRSLAGQSLMAAFGLDGHPWLYFGAYPWCLDCDGTGYLPCQDQDMSIMRQSGNCTVCGEWSFKLFHCTKDDHSDVEGSARHYQGEDEADHVAIVGAAPLVDALTHTLDEHRAVS